MSIYSNVTEQDLDNLRKLAQQQKNQRALKIKNRILKQTHDINLAESLRPINKKLEEVKESTQKIGEIVFLATLLKKQMMEEFFGMDFQLKKWVVINLKLMRRFIKNSKYSKIIN